VRSEDYGAVVYDLDGTLVRLAVDWDAVAADVESAYREAGVDPGGRDLWDLLGASADNGLRAAVERALSDHERPGARASERLPTADEVPDASVPVGVCSLNCEDAVETALELDRHDLSAHVDSVVGRDTVERWKPDPLPLTTALEGLGVAPERALFVGDSPRDELTAQRAGVDFAYVADR
jgi:phosphoglycolate phosphatase